MKAKLKEMADLRTEIDCLVPRTDENQKRLKPVTER
jgi:hypothetical protein